MHRRRRPPSSRPAWVGRAGAVLAVTLVHDVEELLTVPAALRRPPLAPLLDRWNLSAQRLDRDFQVLNWVVSAGAAVAVLVGTRQQRPVLPGVVAATMLLNVVVPHVPAAVRSRGYAPGVITAVALVLPVTSRYLLQGRRDGVLDRSQVRRCLASAAGLVVLGLPLGMVLTDRVVTRLVGDPDAAPGTHGVRR